MKVWVLMDTTKNTGSDGILGVFENESKAKLYLADYILENEIDTIASYVELKEFTVFK